jgi:hypothetical protein
MEEELNVLDVLYRLFETEQAFYRTVRFMQAGREGLMAAQLRNSAATIALLRQYSVTSNRTVTYTATIPFNMPTGWDEPVVIRPSAAEITGATSTVPTPPTETNCSICQDSLVEPGTRINHCGHVFHNNCIAEWFTQSVRCPLCRHDIREVGSAAPTASDSAHGQPPLSTRLVSWLVGANPTGHTVETAGSAEHHV